MGRPRNCDCLCGTGSCKRSEIKRYVRATSFLGSEIGDEAIFWAGYETGTYSQVWRADATGEQGVKLVEGVRFTTHGITAEGATMHGRQSPTGGEVTILDECHPTGLHNAGLGIPFNKTIQSGGHIVASDVTQITVPIGILTGFSSGARIRYVRLLNGTTPTTSIIDLDDGSYSARFVKGNTLNKGFSTFQGGEFVMSLTGNEASITPSLGVEFGIDVWFELNAYPVGSCLLQTGYFDTGVYNPLTMPHGIAAVRVSSNTGFDRDIHDYKLTFSGGTYRPDGTVSDVFKFYDNDRAVSDFCSVKAGTFSSQYQIYECNLIWVEEIPALVFYPSSSQDGETELVYVPEDTAGYIQERGTINTAGTTRYQWYQEPGGKWDGSSATTFVKAFAPQESATSGPWLDATSTDAPPTIVVERYTI